MSKYLISDEKKVTANRLIEMKRKSEKIAVLTSYDYTTARIVDEAGVDAILIGDSASNVMAGNATTLPITLDQMIYHATCVARGVKRAFVMCDMPFGTYTNPQDGVKNSVRVMQESGVDGVKMEGGVEIAETIRQIIQAAIKFLECLHPIIHLLIPFNKKGSAPKRDEASRYHPSLGPKRPTLYTDNGGSRN